ncbi:MAG: inositol monophosphatase family protein [Armatimonadota bacterium]
MTDLEVLKDITYRAGKLALSYYGRVVPSEKPDHSFVTEADKVVEDFLRTELAKHFPGVEVLGEEVEQGVKKDVAWVIDPIDGTANFVAGVPIWAVSVGLVEDGIPKMGTVYYPAYDEFYSAQEGKGAWLNEKQIFARQDRIIRHDDLLGLSTLSIKRMKVNLPCKVRSLGTAVACFTFVAKGSFIGGVLTDNRVWDIAAGWIIAKEAGAEVVYLLTGEPISHLILNREQLPPQLVAPPQFIDTLRRGIQVS